VTRPPAPSVEDARRSLQAKDYARAADTAQRILAAEPADAGARAVLEQAQRSQRAVATALAEARNGLQAGDGERASKALEALLSLAPQHPELPGLSARLNDLLRSQADEARRALERARRQPPAGVPPAVTPPPATAPPATLAASPPATFPPAQTEAASRQAIRGVLDEFRAAFERRDVDALRAVQPGVDYEFMKRTFASVTGYTVRIDVGDVKVQGDTATASCLVTYNPVPKPAGKTKPIPTVFHLRRSGQLWLIERLERN
jgi:hypothetical protein